MTQIFLDFYHFFTFGSKTVGSDITIFIKILFTLGIIKVNFASALAYNKIRSFAPQITPFCRDFVHAQHNSSKLSSAFTYHKIRYTDDTDTMRIL